jgi:hypothetical protein
LMVPFDDFTSAAASSLAAPLFVGNVNIISWYGLFLVTNLKLSKL